MKQNIRDMFQKPVAAGFECGWLPYNQLDLLAGTHHVPPYMKDHYKFVQKLGVTLARDGLSPLHPRLPRIQAAAERKLNVIWDLDHYYEFREDEATIHALHCATSHTVTNGEDAPLLVCPTNEPSVAHRFSPLMTLQNRIELGKHMLSVVRNSVRNVVVMTSDPVHNLNEDQWTGHDQLADDADIIGVNIYPYYLHEDLAVHEILLAAWERYHKPVFISETSLHTGHSQLGYRDIHTKQAWLFYITNEIIIAQENGADVLGLCWYPIINTPSWDGEPNVYWDHGLFDNFGYIDHDLGGTIKMLNRSQ